MHDPLQMLLYSGCVTALKSSMAVHECNETPLDPAPLLEKDPVIPLFVST